MRKTFRKWIFIIAGLFFMGIGLMLLRVTLTEYRQDEEFLKYLGMAIFLFVMGFCFAYFSKSIADANEPEHIGKANKYYTRQLLLFFALLIAYMAAAIRALMRSPTDQTVVIVFVGWVVIIGALIWLLVRSVKQRKRMKIQDGFFEKVKIHENDSIFTMIVDCCWFEDGKTYLRGTVHGTVSLQDTFYLYYLNGDTFSSKVVGIEVEGNAIPSVSDKKATILIKTKKEIYLPRYTICSSVIPCPKEGLDHIITNARVLGLLEAKVEQWDLPYYFNFLEDALIHGRYLIRMERLDKENSAFQKFHDYFFGYFGSFQLRTVSSEEENEVLAVYTDWVALAQGKEESTPEKEAKVVSFDDLQRLAQDTLHIPVVVNPFSSSFFLSLELLQAITNSNGYQEEFGEKKEE